LQNTKSGRRQAFLEKTAAGVEEDISRSRPSATFRRGGGEKRPGDQKKDGLRKPQGLKKKKKQRISLRRRAGKRRNSSMRKTFSRPSRGGSSGKRENTETKRKDTIFRQGEAQRRCTPQKKEIITETGKSSVE